GSRERGANTKDLYVRSLIEPIDAERAHCIRGKLVLAGRRGDTEPARTSKSGHPVLRPIINLAPMNQRQRPINSDIAQMSTGAARQTLVFEDEKVPHISGDDLACSFYLCLLRACWKPFFAPGRQVDSCAIIPGAQGRARMTLKCLPMGWLSSVGATPLASARLRADAEFNKCRTSPASVMKGRHGARHTHVDDFSAFEIALRHADP
ncbi:unnamed protein product, partial [Prorocentrum cordatum]